VVGTTYRANATYYDRTFNRSESITYTFTALAPTPVVKVTTKEIYAIPLDVKIVTSVTDPYGAGFVAEWSCQRANGTACPASLTDALADNATNSGVLIGGPIPQGEYVLWMTYKGIRSSNISLTVMCDVSLLTDERKCPVMCPYTCPDEACARTLTSCPCTLEAKISDTTLNLWPAQVDGQIDPTVAVTLTVAAQYRQSVGSCSAFNFNPYMKIRWALFIEANTSATPLPSNIVTNASSLMIDAMYFTPFVKYTLVASFFDIFDDYATNIMYEFIATPPDPQVSVTPRGSSMVVGPTAITLHAKVVDVYMGTTLGIWHCMTATAGNCPIPLAAGISENGTNTQAYIAGPVPAGTYTLWMTYKAITSAPLTLTVFAIEVPLVSLFLGSVPLVEPAMFQRSQSVSFGVGVVFNGTYTLTWTVNGAPYGNEGYLVVPGTALLQTTSLNAPVNNIIIVRAEATSDSAIYGESSVSVQIAPTATVSLDSVENENNATHPLLMTSHNAKLSFSSANVPPSLLVGYEVGYYIAGVKFPVARTSDSTATFVAPVSAEAEINFFVDLHLNGKLAATANRTYAAVMPQNRTSLLANLAEAFSTSTGDPAQLGMAFANLLNFAIASADSTAVDSTSVRNTVFSNLDLVASAPGLDFNGLVSGLSAMVKPKTATTAPGTPAQETKLSAEDATTVLRFLHQVVAKLNEAGIGSVLDMQDSVPEEKKVDLFDIFVMAAEALVAAIGETKAVSRGGTTVSNYGFMGASKASTSTGDASMSTTGSLGLDPNTRANIGGVNTETSFGAAQNGRSPSTKGATYSVAKVNDDGTKSAHKVENLEEPILIVMASTDGLMAVCRYWNTVSQTWQTDGVWLYSYTDTTITCATRHLTTFAGFDGTSSSTTAVTASTIALAFILLAQLLWAH